MSFQTNLPIDLVGKITMLRNILVARATSTTGDNAAFVVLRAQLMKDVALREKLPDCVLTCRDLDQFWGYIKEQASTYAARRTIIWNEFNPLLEFLAASTAPKVAAMANETKAVKCHCPKCGSGRKAFVRGEHKQNSSDEIDGGQFSVDFSETYRILECAGCETLFCQRTLWCSEWQDFYDPDSGVQISYWPSTTRWQRPKWVDHDLEHDLSGILIEVYSAFNNEMPILSAIGVRTAFDRATELLVSCLANQFIQSS